MKISTSLIYAKKVNKSSIINVTGDVMLPGDEFYNSFYDDEFKRVTQDLNYNLHRFFTDDYINNKKMYYKELIYYLLNKIYGIFNEKVILDINRIKEELEELPIDLFSENEDYIYLDICEDAIYLINDIHNFTLVPKTYKATYEKYKNYGITPICLSSQQSFKEMYYYVIFLVNLFDIMYRDDIELLDDLYNSDDTIHEIMYLGGFC